MEIILILILVASIPLIIAIVVFFIKRSLGLPTVKREPTKAKALAPHQSSLGCLVPVIILISGLFRRICG